MVKKEVLKDIKNKVDNLDSNKKNDLIKTITKNEIWYYDMDIDSVIDILITLGYDKNTAINIYKILVIG